MAMRAVVGFLLALSAGCFSSGSSALDLGDDGGARGTCGVDADCVGAGASCCGCPEYAVSVASPYAAACEDLDCPPPVGCSAAPRCDQGECVLACVEVTCDQICAGGFVADAAGCLTCSCGLSPVSPACGADADCVRVPADCCGCALGGADMAVPADEEQAFRDQLGCTATPVCPGVDVCVPGAVARCEVDRCVLDAGGPPSLPAGACGTPGLPACPPGQLCVLNSDGIATMAGVGVCQ